MCARFVRSLGAAAIVIATATPLLAGPRFDNAEYAARRAKLMEKIPDGIAIIWGAQTIPSYYRYAQNNDFMYLTGAEIPNAVLIVDGLAKSSTLMFTSTEAAARNDGISAELVRSPKAFTGIEHIAPIESLDGLLMGIANRAKVVYTPFRPEELYREASLEKLRTLQRNMTLHNWDGRLTRELQFVKLFKERFPHVEVRDCSPLIWDLRTIKSPAEIDVLRRAGRIGVLAHSAILKATRPGMYEYEVSALFNYTCEKEGAQESAYGVIISSGENHPYVHYNRHDRLLKDGDFLVVDAGPDLDYYDIDITTSFPANGTFTPRQREVYEASLAVHEANLQVYRPGLTLEQCRREVEAILTKRGFDLTKDYFQRMRGGFGHYVGMATHDVGGGPQVLKPGMVFANEPYMTWPGEDLGVRVEDTILITETGCENLTAGIPRSVKEIEDAMAAGRTNGTPSPAASDAARVLPISGSAWAGSSVNVVANARQPVFTHGQTQYAAFYDADRFVVLARRSVDGGPWETRRTAYQGNAANAHNSISLAVDGAGILHVAWDHHANPLNYVRGAAPGSLDLGQRQAMTGQMESRVTYPQFHRLPGGDLLFLYRDGASGRGSLALTRYAVATGRWTMVHTNLIDGEGERSPYWDMVIDRRGGLHLAWVWRESPDVATNHDLCYARSDDGGRTWSTSGGAPLAVPMSARTAEYAARIPQRSNLMNAPAIAADEAGRPYVVTYWSPAPGATPQFHVVHHDGAAWRVIAGPAQPEGFTLAGGGTKAPPISRAVVLVEPAGREHRVHLIFRDPGPARGGRVVAATLERLSAPSWSVRELMPGPVGAWEPAIDPAAWSLTHEAQMLVQQVVQRDGDDRTGVAPPTPIGLLVWKPR